MDRSLEFHRTKKKVIALLNTIEDGSGMNDISDNWLIDQTNAEAFKQALELMKQAEVLVDELQKGGRGDA